MLKDLTINMMVKNEERYIRQTLRSVLPHVEHAIIFDTGSTDNTRQIIFDELKSYNDDNFIFWGYDVAGDSINWNGNHLSKELTALRNQMLRMTKTEFVWQVDGDEIYTESAIKDLEIGLKILKTEKEYKGIQVPIKWCVSDEHFVRPGPFPKTLRVMPQNGCWIGEFPNEFLFIDGLPMTMTDPRCITTSNPFLHMSMALHPERRPVSGSIIELTGIEKEKLCLKN